MQELSARAAAEALERGTQALELTAQLWGHRDDSQAGPVGLEAHAPAMIRLGAFFLDGGSAVPSNQGRSAPLNLSPSGPQLMWNINVEGAMPRFWPPRPHPFWSFTLTPIHRYFLHGHMRITEVEVEGLDDFRQRFVAGDGVLIAPNHSHSSDAEVMVDVGRRSGQQFYFMAAWQVFRLNWGWAGFLMQRLGAFSVDREGSDRRSVKQAVELLTTGKRLVVFPEGEIYHLNERLAPLLDGVAFMALTAQRELEKTRPDARTWMVPAAIRYRSHEESL
jgi:1-acyl-sn-glycerol-3-phosphate acyltransferase